MLETIREYAAQRLEESGDTQTLWLRHAKWCLAIARAREGVRTEEAFDELEEEQSNFRAVLDWMMNSEPTGLVELTGLLWGAWLERGHVVEAQYRLDEALLMAGLEPSPKRARLLAGALGQPSGPAIARRHEHLVKSSSPLRVAWIVRNARQVP